MMRLYKTNRVGTGRAAHHHIIYLNQDRLLGAASTDANHTHEIQWVPPTPPIPPEIDPQTGQPLGPERPGQPGYWAVLPAGKDGHTHEIQNYYNSTEKPSKKDQAKIESDTIAETLRIYKACKEYEAKSIDKAKESEDFYTGLGQWDEQQKNTLQSQDRACLTINKIAPNIDTLCGYQREQRTDFRFRPQEGGDQRVAELADIVIKNIIETNDYPFEESEAFKDGAITGRGLLGITFDKTRELLGEILIDKRPWDKTYFGPHERLDAEDCEVICSYKWYSTERLKSEYEDKAEEIEKKWEEDLELISRHVTYNDDQYMHGGNETLISPDIVNIIKKEIKVIECQRKIWKQEAVAVHQQDEYVLNVSNWDKEDQADVGTIPGLKLIKKPVQRIRITTIAGRTLLSDENPSDAVNNDFNIIPVYCYKRGDLWWGKIEAAKDPQREINKRHSQAVDIGNTMAAYGWFIDQSTFPDDKTKAQFKTNSSRPGFLQEVTSLGNLPQKVEGVKFPAELVQLMQVGDAELQAILNITVQPYGANESGAALMQKQKLKLAGNEFFFENLRLARRKMARLLLGYIKKHYTAERIFKLVQDSSAKNEAQIGGRPASSYSQEEISALLQNQDLTKYDVAIDEANYSPTIRLANGLLLADMAKAGMPIPPQAIIDQMDTIPAKTKQEIFQMMQAQQEGQAKAEDAKMQMEIGKTLIAKGIMPNGQPIPGQTPQAAPQPAPLPSPVQQVGQPVPQAQTPQQMALAELMAQQIQHQGEKLAVMEQAVVGQNMENERATGIAVEAIDTMKELQGTLTALTVAVGNLIKPPGKKVGKITRDDGSESIVELIDAGE